MQTWNIVTEGSALSVSNRTVSVQTVTELHNVQGDVDVCVDVCV